MSFNLLVVDDSPSMRGVIKKSILLAGTNVGSFVEAGNGQEALDRLTGNWVDLVVTDLYMPVMDGFELIRKMKEDEFLRVIPIIVVSTEGRESRLEEIHRLGVTGFIHKPFRPESIRDLIIQCLGVEEYGRSGADSGESDF